MKFKKLCIFTILMFMGAFRVDALSFSVSGSSQVPTNLDGEFAVNIKTDGEKPEKINLILDYDNTKIKLTEEKSNNLGYATVINDNNIWITKTAKDFEDGNIIKFKVTNISTASESTSIKVKNIVVDGAALEDENSTEISKEVYLKYVEATTTRAKNTSAKLTNFTVKNATFKPAFSQSIKDYKIYVNKDTIKQITINPSYEQSGVTLEVTCKMGCTSHTDLPNKLDLVMGKNEAEFVFTSEDGKTKETYNFIIYRGATTDGSNKLASLTVEGLELKEKFNKDILDYTLEVPFETEKVNVIATAEDENADVQIKGNENLQVGDNVVTITVTSAESEEKKIYNITIKRNEFTPAEDTTTTTVPVIPTTDDNKKDNSTLLIILIALGGTIIIGLAAYFIFFKKDKKDENSEKKKDVSVKEKINDEGIIESPQIDEEKEPTTVDDALKDLMQTKELEIKE